MDRYRFDRKGNVVPERRRLSHLFNTDDYRRGDLIFAPRSSSPARLRFRERSHRQAA